MNLATLVKLKFAFYTFWALANAWAMAMAGVKWNSMTWEEQSVLIAGMSMNWMGFMLAFLDKSHSDLQRSKQNGVDNSTPPIKTTA